MSTFQIPTTTLGAGSQPMPPEDRLDFIPMPGSMEVYRTPLLADEERLGRLPRAGALLRELACHLDDWQPDAGATPLDLDPLDAAHLALIDDLLGEGEVSVVCDGDPGARIQESIFAGVWRVQETDASGTLTGHCVEVGAIPRRVCETAGRTPGELAIPDVAPAGVANALPLLVEIVDRARASRAGDPAHVINLTLLPFSEADHAFLDERLGTGPVTMLSRGFGNCRITSTRLPHVWWVRYFNSMNTLILNTLEVVDVPPVACAAPEDIAASARRLTDVLDTLS